MASITDIKRKILELAPAPFQEFCDTLISKHGYGEIHGLGMKAGTGNTTKGNPDTYFRKENGKYLLVAYTITQKDIYRKLKNDIDKCLNPAMTGLELTSIDEIICCHTSSNLTPGDDKKLHDYCQSKGISLSIWGIDELANQVHNHYRSLANLLGLNIDTNQIMSADDFVALYDSHGISAPLSTCFQYRENEKEEITEALNDNPVVVITGKAGVGKTRLVLEVVTNFAQNNGYKLLCVKNNNLGLFNDLVAATEEPDRYLFFIDDANELAELNQILEYTIKRKKGYLVKVIVTVRDYAKEKVIFIVNQYTNSRIIEVSSFSDDEIRGFLNDNLNIRNEDYIKQIIRIAEGNPRIAYMAGKLAVEKQNISSIKDVSQIYNAYYEKYINGTIGNDDDLCFAAGVLSVVNAVVLSNMSVLNSLLKEYGITTEDFKKKILQLASLEVVEIQLDQVATISDQCLANYMLYYVFFVKKLISFSSILETGYKNFRNGVLRTINTLLNIFNSEVTRSYCEQEILKVWDKLKSTRDTAYKDFAKDFHVFRPEESFLLAQQIIENIASEEFDIYKIDLSKNSYCLHEDVLHFLSGYQYSDYLEYVIEILLEYCSKTSTTLVSGYKWLENSYGMDVSSYKYRYYNQTKISEYLLKYIAEGNTIAMFVGFNWAKYSLGFSFHPTETGRGNQLIIYNINIKASDGLTKYRTICWKILITLASFVEWKDKVTRYLDSYSCHLHGEPDIEIVKTDVEFVEQLLSILNCDNVSFLKTIQRLLDCGNRVGVNFNNQWLSLLTGKDWELYKLLEDDFFSSGMEYEEYEAKKKTMIAEYGKNISTQDISDLVDCMSRIISDITESRGAYSITHNFELIIQQFDKTKLEVFLNEFMNNGLNISISPWIVLEPLNKGEDSIKLFSYIQQAEFSQKNEWLFCFFNTLPNEKVGSEVLQDFLSFLQSDSDRHVHSSAYRTLRVLDKFLKIEPNIYPLACSIIFKKRHYNPFIVKIYFELLFHDQIYTPEELLKLFKFNLGLLQEIYFYILQESQSIDLNGVFLTKFLALEESWIQKYSAFFWDDEAKHKGYNQYRNSALWKTENYIEYFDYIFYHFPKEEMYLWRIGCVFKDAFTCEDDDTNIELHQKEWIKHIITVNSSSEIINIIFDFVCELKYEIRRLAIQTFLDINQEYETFSKLSLLPNHWSGNESLVPAYQAQIDFLESLLPLVHEVKFLKHRALIKSRIEMLREMIKREEVDVICRNLYM